MFVALVYRYVWCEMNVFFRRFLKSLSKKPHRNFLCKIYWSIVFLRRLWHQSMRKIFLTEIRLIHAEQMSLYNFIILRKKQWSENFLKRYSNTGVFMWNSWNFQEQWWLLLKTHSMWLHVVHKLAIFSRSMCLKRKEVLLVLYYIDKNWYHFIKEYLE